MAKDAVPDALDEGTREEASGSEQDETREPDRSGSDWGLAMAIAPTFYALVFAAVATFVYEIRWAFVALLSLAYLVLAIGFLGLYVEVNRTLEHLSIQTRRLVNILITCFGVAACGLSLALLKHMAAQWVFGLLLALGSLAILILLERWGGSLPVKFRYYAISLVAVILGAIFSTLSVLTARQPLSIVFGVLAVLAFLVAASLLAKGLQVTITLSARSREPRADLGAEAGSAPSRLKRSEHVVRRIGGLVAWLAGLAAAVATIYAALTRIEL